MRVRGDGIFHASHRVILLVGTEGHVINAVVLQQNLHFSVLFFVVATQHLQVLRQLAHLQPQIAVFSHQKSIISERVLQMLLQLSDLDQPFLLHHWLIDINRIFDWHLIGHIYPHWHLHNLFPFDGRRLDIDWLVDVDWFFYDSWHLNIHSFYYFLWHFLHHLHYHLLLHLDILRNFHYFFNDPLGTSDHLRYLHDHFNWLLDNDFFDYLLGGSQIQSLDLFFAFLEKPSEHVQIHSQSIVLSLQLRDDFLMIAANLGPVPVILKLEVEPHPFFLRLFEVIFQLPYFFEQLLKAVLVLVIFLDLDLDFLVGLGCWSIDGDIFEVHLLLAHWDADWRPWFHLFPSVGLLLFGLFEGLALALNDCFPLDDDGLLQGEFLFGCRDVGLAFLDDLDLLLLLGLFAELGLQELRLAFEAGHRYSITFKYIKQTI